MVCRTEGKISIVTGNNHNICWAKYFLESILETEISSLLLPDVAMCSDVSVEVGRVAECLVAVRTLVGGCRAVSRLVFLKVSFLPESLLANGTLEGTFS